MKTAHVEDEFVLVPLPGDPPPPYPKKIDSLAIIEQLKKDPGRWYLVRTGAPGSSMSWWKKKGCEAKSRWDPQSLTYEYYAMWPKEGGEA